jgi:transcriptional regulator with XRE-family HTH domain
MTTYISKNNTNIQPEDVRDPALTDVARYVAKQVRHFRRNAGLSQKELAKHLFCTYQQLQKYETGQNRLTVERLYLIARFFAVSIESFFPGHEVRGHPLLEQYFKLPDEKRALVAVLMKSLGEK